MVIFPKTSLTQAQRDVLAAAVPVVEFPDYDLHLYFDEDPTSVQHGSLMMVPFHAGTLTAIEGSTAQTIFFDACRIVDQMNILGHPIDAIARRRLEMEFGRALEEEKRESRTYIPRGYMKRWIVHDSKDSFLKHTNIDEGNLHDSLS